MLPGLFSDDFGLSGLMLREALISEDQEAQLVQRAALEPLAPFEFQGWLGRRHTRSYGWTFDFGRNRLVRDDPIPDWLLLLRDQAAIFSGVQAEALAHVLLTRYDPGAGIGWHKDRPSFDHVVGVSLGAPCILRLRRRTATGFRRLKVPLAPRGAYHLSGEARHAWEHSIAPMQETRWSITFRSLAA